MDNIINNIETEISNLKQVISSDDFKKNFNIEIDNRYRQNIISKINEVLKIVKIDYNRALDNVNNFVKLIIKMLDLYGKHLKIKTKIINYDFIKKGYVDFCFKDYDEINSKIKTIIKIVDLRKKEELTKNICPDNIKLLNLLNKQSYTNYSDAINFVEELDSLKEVKRNIIEKIENIVSDGLINVQKLDYLLDKLKSCKFLLDQKKKLTHKKIQELNEKINSLKTKDNVLWPSYHQINNYNDSEEIKRYNESIFMKIEKYINNVDEVSLSLIVAFCAQLNLFKVTYTDKVSGKYEEFIIKDTKKKSYINYLKNWIKSFKRFLDTNVGEF